MKKDATEIFPFPGSDINQLCGALTFNIFANFEIKTSSAELTS